MKQLLRSMFCLGLLLSIGVGRVYPDDCSSGGCSTSNCTPCATTPCTPCTPCAPTTTNCNTTCNTNPCNDNDRCDDKRCESDRDANREDKDCNKCITTIDTSRASTCGCPLVSTFVAFRPEGANSAREMVGWLWEINKPFMCDPYGAAYVAYEYQKTFKNERTARHLFGGNTLKFAGSLAPDRQKDELLADNFGLSRTFRGQVSFCPTIQRNIIDLGYYMGLDCWLQGAFLRFHAPISVAKWNLHAHEKVCTPDCNPPAFNTCYVSSSGQAANPAATLKQALSGEFLFGDMQNPWRGGRFSFCEKTRTDLSDIDVIFGYNWWNNDCHHLGVYAQAILPTARKPNGRFLFEPYTGQNHFGLGGGIEGHTVIWSCENQNLALFWEGYAVHLFKNKQCRVFDFCGLPFSRYSLIKEFEGDGSTFNYTGRLFSATEFTTRHVDVKIDVLGEVSVLLAYRCWGWGLDLGWNLFGQSREKIERRCDEACVTNKKFCFKGIQDVCCTSFPVICVPTGIPGGFVREIFANGATLPVGSITCVTPVDDGGTCILGPNGGTPVTTSVTTTVPNNTCQPNATAFNANPVIGTAPDLNTACSIALASESTASVPATGIPVDTVTPANGFVYCTNITPTEFLDVSQIDFRSGEGNSLFTQKVFANLSYTCYDSCGWNPCISVGGEVEFSSKRECGSDCGKDANMWGVWVKGNISF